MNIFSTVLATAQDPTTAFSIGSMDIKWYALFIVSAMIIGLAYVCTQCKKINLNTD
ncbi:MAG: prolipoprotein diacylglyceryl transferase, partial [Clostridia bacterium]|nr:prolipoprotein diacylglyceryl transferase [Clostridia bacterium]